MVVSLCTKLNVNERASERLAESRSKSTRNVAPVIEAGVGVPERRKLLCVKVPTVNTVPSSGSTVAVLPVNE